MSIRQRPGTAAGGRPVRHRLVGAHAEVVAVLRNANARGVLVDVGTAEFVAPGRVAVPVTLLEPVRTVARPAVRRYVKVAAAVAALLALGTAGYGAAWLLVEWLIANLLVVLGFLGVLVAVGLVLVKTGSCPGRHCPGCVD